MTRVAVTVRESPPTSVGLASCTALAACSSTPRTVKSAHGVGTSSSVLTANPDAVMFFIEVVENLGSAESHELAFTHPAVDIVTTSYGASIPETGFPLPEDRAFEFTYEGVVNRGKLHFSSGGNTVVRASTDTDSTAELEIQLTGLLSLGAYDFYL